MVEALTLALQAFHAGNLSESERLLDTLWLEFPDPAVAALQGQVMRAARRWHESISWFEKSLLADPKDLRPAIAISQIQRLIGDTQAAEYCLEQVVLQSSFILALNPDEPHYLHVLGLAYAELSKPTDAIASLESALSIDPSNIEVLSSLATLLANEGRLSEAFDRYSQLAAEEPENPYHRINQALMLHRSGENEASLQQLGNLIDRIPQGNPACIEAFQFVASTAGKPWLKTRERMARDYWRRDTCMPYSKRQVPSRSAPHKAPLRVGILTAEIGTHPVSFFLAGLLIHCDRSRLHLEAIQTQPREETRNRELLSLTDDWLLLPQANADQCRALIHNRSYDVIIETSGFTAFSGLHLLAERLAPVQCHYVGFHASTFLPTIDWFIADKSLVPSELENQFSERVWRLPRPWAAYTPPEALPPLRSLPPDVGPVLGSCNQTAKIGNDTLRYWASALNAIPSAHLLIKERCTADSNICLRIVRILEAEGISADRIEFLPWALDWKTHMEFYNRIDIALDTTPWSSATTAFEALSMGVPLVAIRGKTMAGRMSSAVLDGVGKPEWISDDPDSFAEITHRLTTNLPRLRSQRQQRRDIALTSPLFDPLDLAKCIEEALEQMYALSQTRD